MTLEAKFRKLDMHFESIEIEMPPKPKFMEVDMQFKSIGY